MKGVSRSLLVVAVVALASTAFALEDGSPSKPKKALKSQTPVNYFANFLKPSKSEVAVDFGAFNIPGKAAWSIKAGSYFGLWYFFNIFYNVANKKALNALNLPWLQSLACVGVGIPYIALIWALGVRDTPKIDNKLLPSIIQQSSLHAAGNVGGNVAFGAGALGFAHVLKSCEPAFTAIFSGLINGKWQHPFVYATLIPIMGGVAYASASEVNFNMLQFVSAMVSNVAFSLRAVLGKKTMSDRSIREVAKLDGPNTFSVLQIGATLLTIPFVVAVEGWRTLAPWTHPSWKAAIGKLDHAGAMITEGYLWKQLILSGLMFQLYYESAFLALDAVSPVTHSIGNNIKRVVIVITSVIIFGQKMSTQSMIGSSIAIAGVFLYAQVSEMYSNIANRAK